MSNPEINAFPIAAKEQETLHNKRAQRTGAITAGVIVLVYGGFFRWIFGTPWMEVTGGVVSNAFVFSVPFSCGALSVAIGRWMGSSRWYIFALYVPLGAIFVGLVICVITAIEAVICVIMAIPILIGAVFLGGMIANAALPKKTNRTYLHMSLAALLPFVATWFESSHTWPEEKKSITNTVTILAPAEKIWPEIASVRAINPQELSDSWIYWIGFPRPIAATLDRHEIGGIRVATFERNVSFFEQITEWQKLKKLAFSIHADPAFIPSNSFDQHIIVGGRFYDVLDGVYEIEPVSNTECRLHLTSHHRLSTHFNSYAGWWSEQIMNEIQGTILEVIRKRSEAL